MFYNCFRNSVRRDDYKCDSKCRYKTICTLKKAHHNTELCSHVAGYDQFARIKTLFSRKKLLETEQYFRTTSDAYQMLSEMSQKFSRDAKSALKKKFLNLITW